MRAPAEGAEPRASTEQPTRAALAGACGGSCGARRGLRLARVCVRVLALAVAVVAIAAASSGCATRAAFQERLLALGDPAAGLAHPVRIPRDASLAAALVGSGRAAVEDAERLRFVRALERQGEPYRAATELLRLASAHEGTPRGHLFWFLAVEVHVREQSYADAARHLALLAEEPLEPALCGWVALRRAQCALLDPAAAAPPVASGGGDDRDRVDGEGPDGAASAGGAVAGLALFFRAGLHHVALVRALREGDLIAAAGAWERFAAAAASVPGLRRVDGGALLAVLAERPTKRAWLAGLLAALLPGAGHLYAEEAKSAALAFGLSGLAGAAAIESVLEGLIAPGVLFGAFALTFYVGNIVGAIEAAETFDRLIREDSATFASQHLFEPAFYAAWRLGPTDDAPLALEHLSPFHRAP